MNFPFFSPSLPFPQFCPVPTDATLSASDRSGEGRKQFFFSWALPVHTHIEHMQWESGGRGEHCPTKAGKGTSVHFFWHFALHRLLFFRGRAGLPPSPTLSSSVRKGGRKEAKCQKVFLHPPPPPTSFPLFSAPGGGGGSEGRRRRAAEGGAAAIAALPAVGGPQLGRRGRSRRR